MQLVQQTFTKALPVATSDTEPLSQFDNRPPDAIWVGTGGIVQAVFGDSSVVAFTVPDATVLPIRGLLRINQTSTTADDMVALWQA